MRHNGREFLCSAARFKHKTVRFGKISSGDSAKHVLNVIREVTNMIENKSLCRMEKLNNNSNFVV